ncbi:hypothetical protein MMC31_007538 [Peltigera leucophlebia]|nr:hypothetical protein [Peltigera leucophlebia]
MEFDLLSAENYHEGTYDGTDVLGLEGQGNQWMGGVVQTLPQTSKPPKSKKPSANPRGRQSTAERGKKKMSLDDVHGIRQRGRPRLDTRDETATEVQPPICERCVPPKLTLQQRRRTQIRLAQRAYRQRKETTISALNKKVAALESTIERMHESFLEFNDKAIASNIGRWEPSLAEDLKATMGRFIDYAKIMEPNSEIDEEELSSEMPLRLVKNDDMHDGTSLSLPSITEQPAQPQSLFRMNEPVPMATTSTLPLEYQNYQTAEGTSNTQASAFEISQALQTSDLGDASWNTAELPHFYPNEAPFPSLNEPLPPPVTYSFQESSFARRLLRSTVEAAVRLLTDPNSRREDIFRFCRYTFTWVTRARCLAKLKSLLAATTRESLEVWTAPQWHLGGSGLHYPRSGLDVGSSPPPGWTAREPMGPRRAMNVETPLDPSLDINAVVKLMGIEGEWFDSNDVEQYLRTKGILLDGQANWAEVDLAPEPNPSTTDSPVASSRNSSGGPQSPHNPSPTFNSALIQQVDTEYWGNENAAMFSLLDTGTGIPFTESSSFNPKSFNSTNNFRANVFSYDAPNTRYQNKAYLDVEKFIRSAFHSLLLSAGRMLTIWIALVNSAVCLGRTPGFRKSAIDSAYDTAIREAIL